MRRLGIGVGAALAVALPAALLAQILDALGDDDGTTAIVYLLALVVLLGTAVGGFVVGRRGGSLLVAATSGLIAVGLVQVLGVARRQVADEDVSWAAIPLTVALGVALAVVGGAMGRRRPGRKRP